jgi:uncharacterized integral membrane protein
MLLFLILGLLLGAASVIFALQNVIPVTVSFFSWQIQGSLSLVILAAVLTGVLTCLFFTIPEMIANHFRFRSMRKENKALADEVERQKSLLAQEMAKKDLIVEQRTVETTTTTI